MPRSLELKRELADGLSTGQIEAKKKKEHDLAVYYGIEKLNEIRKKIDDRWKEIQGRITEAEGRIQELRTEADSLSEDEFERRYSAIQTEVDNLEKYATLADESGRDRYITEFTRVEQVRNYENFMERFPMYWVPRKREIGRLMAIAKQMHEARVIKGEVRPEDPIRIVDIGGANGFLGKLMVDLAKENGLKIEYIVVDPDSKVVDQAREAYADEPISFRTEDSASYARRILGQHPEVARLNAELDALKAQYTRSREDLDRLGEIVSQKQEMGLLDESEVAKYKAILAKDFGFDPVELPDDPEEFGSETYSFGDRLHEMHRNRMQALKGRLEKALSRLPANHDLTINSWMPPDRDFTADIRQTNGAAVVYMIETWGATGLQEHGAWPGRPKRPWEEDSYQPGEMYDPQFAWVGHSSPQLARKVYKEQDEDRDTRAFSNAFLVQTRRDLSRDFSQDGSEPEAIGIRIDGVYPWEDRLEELTEGLSPTTRLKRPEERRAGYPTDYHDDLQSLINGIQNGRIRTIPLPEKKPKPTTSAERLIQDLEEGGILSDDKTEYIPPRPTPEAKRRAAERFRRMKSEDPWLYSDSLHHLQEMAAGKNPKNVRTDHYPGWQDEDFAELLEKISEPTTEESEEEPLPASAPLTESREPKSEKTEAIEAKAKRFLEIRKWDPPHYSEIVAQLEEMASGRDPEGLRRRYYPDWTERDFQEVLDRLNAVETQTESSDEQE